MAWVTAGRRKMVKYLADRMEPTGSSRRRGQTGKGRSGNRMHNVV